MPHGSTTAADLGTTEVGSGCEEHPEILPVEASYESSSLSGPGESYKSDRTFCLHTLAYAD